MKKIVISIIILAFVALIGGEVEIVDSNMTFAEATKGTKAPQDLLDSLTLLDVTYYSLDEKLHKGQIIVHKSVEDDVKYFFQMAREEKFPIKQVIPIVKYGWSDDKSMAANNSSAFNYRFIAGTERLSNHSFGKAIDINPYFNPVIYKNPTRISPKGAKYVPGNKGVFTADSRIVKEMKARGWRWGGDWNSLKDYHHFDKP
jgi:hypothetical protein